MRKLVAAVLAACLLLSACGQTAERKQEEAVMHISAKEAKEIMNTQEGYVILDVRNEDEFEEKHIPGAVLIPLGDLENDAEDILTDKNQMILVYCRSGRRSKSAAAILEMLGYTTIREFGGILDWPYETE